MNRTDASKLLSLLVAPNAPVEIKFILSDNPIFSKITRQHLQNKNKKSPPLFEGEHSISQYVSYLASCGMFETAQESIIILPSKITQKQWNTDKNTLARIPIPLQTRAFFFAPLSYKNTLKEDDFKNLGNSYLCYDPSESESEKSMTFLATQYFQKIPPSQISQWVRRACEHYSFDLVLCDDHFLRMKTGHLSFEDALSGSPEVNGFDVAAALSTGDATTLVQRIQQCAHCGESAATIFAAMMYFLKQVIYVQEAFAQTKNLKTAFTQAHIPYPAQARLEKAIKVLKPQKIKTFFQGAPLLEIELRQQKNPYEYLTQSLLSLF
jgi:hypothetical protein